MKDIVILLVVIVALCVLLLATFLVLAFNVKEVHAMREKLERKQNDNEEGNGDESKRG